MRPQIVWTIFRKEVTEALRDRLTLTVVIVLPILLYPLMVMMLGKLQSSQAESEEQRVSQVAIWGEAPAPLLNWLGSTNHLEIKTWTGAPPAIKAGLETGRFRPPAPEKDRESSAAANRKATAREQDQPEDELLQAARSVVTRRDLDAIVIVWPGFKDALKSDGLARISICYDSVRPASQKARDRLSNSLTAFRRSVIRDRERAHSLAEGFTTAVDIRSQNIAPPKRLAGERLGMLLPFVLIMLSATGALYASIDLTAGEKDRATMQTLLCAPVHNLEIVAGKFLAVWSISLLSSLANATSLGATIARAAGTTDMVSLPATSFLLALLLLLPATFTITAFFLAIAMMARDAKDAGNFLGATLTMLMMPMMAALMPGVDLNAWTAFVPLVNISLLIKSVFLGEAKSNVIFLTLLSSLIYASLSIMLAARIFGREQILLGGRGSFLSLLRPDRKSGLLPTPSLALSMFAAVLVLAYYGSLLLEKSGVVTTMLTIQYVFFLAPVIIVAMVMKYPPTTTFALRVPPWRGVLAAILIGVSGWAAVGGIVIRLLPPPESLVKALEKIVLLEDDQSPLWLALLVIAVTPAICEEMLFRGLILTGLRRLGPWAALLISSALFAIAHASIYRLLPTFCLGLFLGFIVLRTGSIFCSMIIHALNNGLAVTLARTPSLAKDFGLEDATFVPWSLTLGATAIIVVALLILRTQPRPNDH